MGGEDAVKKNGSLLRTGGGFTKKVENHRFFITET